ncbi:hypothetical protein DYB37_013869 [Aphanomyces astaci]|uniref:DDE-1 domain-containing protein n=1 Tax=Aphanomyces astaci TaxID=112090 RepID=A0A418FJS6_APHAT|nr:hypothetical protein DYB35_012467 [Aphanomyces astaci]RHZ30790.1 hypothetical protein DYB37_013869 [Aphanomyces astaci]
MPFKVKVQQHRYVNSDHKAAIAHASGIVNERQFCRDIGLKYSTWQGWRRKESDIMASQRNGRKATLGSQGRKTIIPFTEPLLAYMLEQRDNNKHERVFHMMQWVRRSHKLWLTSYIEAKRNEEIRFESLPILDAVWLGYTAHFHSKYASYAKATIYNADETGLYFDMPPGTTMAEIGKSSKVDKTEKHSDRLTALLTIRADGVKLPIMFIVRGQPGGTIEKRELRTYPAGHWYAVQENAWMDERVWLMYLNELADHLIDASVLLVDNLECHVSEKAHDKMAESLFCVIEPLPKTSTSRCQPLDVGVMGPLKAMLKSAWLMEDDEGSGDELTLAEKRMAIINRTIPVWDKISPIPSIIEF